MAEDLSLKGFRTVLEIDTIGVFNMCKAAFSALASESPTNRETGCSVVNISTTFHYGATWYQTHACAAKAAVDSITRQLALEWGQHNIRVNGVAPGPIQDTTGFDKLNGGATQVPLGITQGCIMC